MFSRDVVVLTHLVSLFDQAYKLSNSVESQRPVRASYPKFLIAGAVDLDQAALLLAVRKENRASFGPI